MGSPSAPSRAMRRQQWLEQVDAALRRSGMAGACDLAERALAEGIEHEGLLNLVAGVRFQEGRIEEAAQLLKRARALAPRDPHVLNGLGLCLRAQGRPDAAREAFDAAIRADPRHAAAHYNRGVVLEDLEDLPGARANYEKAIALQRDYAEPLAGLAWLSAQNGDAAEARAFGLRALALAPQHPLARMAVAAADLQDRDYAAAEPKLMALLQDPAITPVNHAIVLGLIGDLRDGQRRPDEAFVTYQACMAELRRLYAPKFEGPGSVSALERAARLAAEFERSPPEPWREAPPARPRAADPAVHAYLVGFPRSGTTLLENVLAAHPNVVSLEEKDVLAPAIRDYLHAEGGVQHLAGIGAGEALKRREAYWTAVRSFGVEPRGRVFIDKMPLASQNLPLIAKLFPNARILFALRDPRDVVLSCFRRRFGMNPSMYQLLTLEGAARYYDAVMRLSELYRERLPLQIHTVRYEDLVDDFSAVAGGACAFLGLEWDEGLHDFAAKARTRGISTPSAAQVARGLNREGKGSWRRYEGQLGPVLPILKPWIERFGYEAE